MHNKSFNFKTEFLYILTFVKNNFFNQKFLFNNKNNNSFIFFNFTDFYKSFLNIFFWSKIRVLYYVNNWIYTTNHKRIAVNYFWFVILSGIVGMVLATLIRLEFAYPGVGIFAGDSLQYLSMATAHGVIMVFFMIMPLLFGAFANFLIPTQLGVHDVAFPRLNSAAFWFLPGGLLMLCQLVCVDRRYQRMNCFNIREIQSILKRKFFTDLINTHDHHTLLDKTAMGLRFKTNNINTINSNVFIFYNYGIEFVPKIRTIDYFFNNEVSKSNILSFNNYSISYSLINFFSKINIFFFINNTYFTLFNFFSYITFLNLNLKNFFNFLISSVLYFYDYSFSIVFLFFNFFNNFLNITSNFVKNYYYFSIFILYSPLSIFSYLFNIFLNFYYNSISYLLNFYYLKSYSYTVINLNIFSLFSKYFNNSSLLDFFYEFFFFIRFFEVLYFYNNTNYYYYYYYFNYIFLFQYFSNFFNNFKTFFSSNNYSLFYDINKFSIKEDKISNTTENHMFINKHNLKTNPSFFNEFIYSRWNYDSYLIYVYILIYLTVTLPLNLFYIIKNMFNLTEISYIINKFYEFLTNWYVPTLLSDNLFYIICKNSDFSKSSLSLQTFSTFFNNLIYFFNLTYSLFSLKLNLLTSINSLFSLINLILINLSFNLFILITNFIDSLNFVLFSNKTNIFFHYFYKILFFNQSKFFNQDISSTKNFYVSNYFNNYDNSFNNKYSNEESSESARYLKFYNPIFKYDYKSGDYFPKLYEKVYSSLFTTINELTSGLRTSPWFLSNKYVETFNTNFGDYYDNIVKTNVFSNVILHSWNSSRFSNTNAFYNFFYTLSNDFNYTNKKWISLNTLNQKFYKMFNTSSMQQRIYSNWRQLKFTREAWRCKLLAARHQKTLFRRYVHEDGVFWSIERNAKDLLPGWAMITPFSSRTRFTAIGKTDIGLLGVFLVLNSSIISGANFLVTYRYLSTLNNRKMRDARVFFTESIIVSCWMMIFANPMLAIAILMLLSDRHWQTSFFDYSGGGDTVLFQHMFWFFGHPEVYVIVIPTFGFTNTMISYYLRKRVSARASLLYSMYTIAFLGFFVWGHHMYMVGLAHTTRMLFSTLTVMISVPAATKIMHWCVTTVNSSISVELPLLFTFTFIFLFVSGGISGMCVAHTGMDVLFHDTFYVIAHFHVMLAGAAMFGSFGGFYFYFPAIFGVKYSRIYAYLHYVYYLLGQLMTVIPMFWLGYAGMPRRVLDYPASMGGWHSVISSGHMLSVAGLMAFFIMIFDSLRQGRAVTRNTFGIGRYNTRLNFYLYEISRLIYVQQKGWFFFRFVKPTSIKLNNLNYLNFEPYETTLITYTFSEK